MANSKFEYVRKFEQLDRCLQNTWIVVRIDGRSFHRFSDKHGFRKPNDERALHLMNSCAEGVLTSMNDVIIGYGQSDEYSFVFKRKTETYNRRASKLSSAICSLFTSTYVFNWSKFFPSTPLQYPPSFDSRVVLYPTTRNLRDYLSWRQVDCHINNLYNTCFWKLVLEGGRTRKEAEARLKVTDSGMKNELLFSEFHMNYNNEPEMFKKGTLLFKSSGLEQKSTCDEATATKQQKSMVISAHVDIIKDTFWKERSHILGDSSKSEDE